MWHTQRLVHCDGEGQRIRTELHGGGAERVGRLARIAPVDPLVTHGTAIHWDVKAFPDRLPDDFLLILRLNIFEGQGSATRTPRGSSHGDHLIDLVGNRFRVPRPIRGARLAAGPLRVWIPTAAGKGVAAHEKARKSGPTS